MKKLLLLSALLIFACTDDEGNPCIYQPTLTTEAVTNITETSATLNGTIDITSENCETPNNTEQGFVYSTEIQPTTDDIQVNVNGTNISTTIEGLEPNTTYYVRSFLTNAFGEFYGNEISFTTIDGLINCDGNLIPTIVYGTQEWTVENACHTTYRDGTPIPQVTDDDEWANLTTGAWCYYDNDPTKGILYNWYAVAGVHDNDENTPNKEFAPVGWHVPMDNEWNILKDYLITNGYNYDGTTNGNKIAKAMASTIGWNTSPTLGSVGNDQSLNNSSGFNAFPEGLRTSDGSFGAGGSSTPFWSSSEDTNSSFASGRLINFDSEMVLLYTHQKLRGFSVRFVRD